MSYLRMHLIIDNFDTVTESLTLFLITRFDLEFYDIIKFIIELNYEMHLDFVTLIEKL